MTSYDKVYDAFLARILEDEWENWLIEEAEKQKVNLVSKAGNNKLKKLAAEKAGDAIVEEARKQGERLVEEAAKKGDALIEKAQKGE